MLPKVKKILYTTDLSQNSTYVFRYALSSAEVHDAKIDVIYVNTPTALALPDALPIVNSAEKLEMTAKLKKRVEDFIELELKDNPSRASRVSSIQVVDGNPIVEILKKADELKPDVLIMGTHSKGLIAHTFLGSVATSVLQRIRIPVYIIPIS